MGLEQTWRWFGPKDPVTLQDAKQAGVTGIVSALHHVAIGEIWSVDEILKRKGAIESEGLRWSVVESLPVHENIKKRTENHRDLIENYKQSIRNIGQCGIGIICYNFMPVLDWSRTDLRMVFRDGSITSIFEMKAFAAFDLFILRRRDAEHNYSTEHIKGAKAFFDGLTNEQQHTLRETVLFGLPGSLEAYTLDQFRNALQEYRDIGFEDLRNHLHSFLREIIPVAEEAGVFMAIHPDDPPWSLLGLPRVVRNKEDVEQLLSVVDSPANGLTLCTGSFGASHDNDLVDMANRFAKRISFLHLRNVSRKENGDFFEENHLDGDVDLFGVMKAVVLEQKRRADEGRIDAWMPVRSDHGHLMLADRMLAMHKKSEVYPGYSLFGRMRGLAELRGLEAAIRRSLGL